jgi:CRP-like cAMP-binding protein
MIMEPLIQLLHTVQPMSPSLEAHLRSKIKFHKYRKGQKIATAGQIAPLILYLERGLIRSCSIVNEKKVSNYFMREGDIIISVLSYFLGIPAVDSIEAEEDCSCWGITRAEQEEAYELFMEFNIHGRKIVAAYYCRF